jgi:hypothetical protein
MLNVKCLILNIKSILKKYIILYISIILYIIWQFLLTLLKYIKPEYYIDFEIDKTKYLDKLFKYYEKKTTQTLNELNEYVSIHKNTGLDNNEKKYFLQLYEKHNNYKTNLNKLKRELKIEN